MGTGPRAPTRPRDITAARAERVDVADGPQVGGAVGIAEQEHRHLLPVEQGGCRGPV